MIGIKTVTREDVKALIDGLDFTAMEVLTMEDCVKKSTEVWASTIDEKLCCIWGLILPSMISSRAYIWLLHTNVVKEHEFVFVRYSQRVIEKVLKTYDSIYGHCVVSQPQSIRWIKWLGAEFQEPEGKFVPFVIRKKNG